MIVAMKKVTLLLAKKHRDSGLKRLRQLGVLHVHDLQPPAAEDIQSLEMKMENIDRALTIIDNDNLPTQTASDDAAAVAEQMLAFTQQKDALTRELGEYQTMQQWFERWSDVSNASVQQLKENGIFVRLYVTDKGAQKNIPGDKMIHVANEIQNTVYLALISEAEDDRLDFKEETIPQIEPSEVHSKINELTQTIEGINAKVTEMAEYQQALIDLKSTLAKQLELSRVKYGMGDFGEIAGLQGFCPVEQLSYVQKAAEQEGWGYIVEEPDNPADVPTLIKTPKWLRMIQPVFSFMGTLPGYEEMDVSLVFLTFFSLFFAMLVGDGGYGLVFLILTILIGRKSKSDFVKLLYVLSLSTIVWGLVTGNWFGSKTIIQLPFLKMFVIPKMDAFSDVSTPFVMQLSLTVGIIQLSVAHLMAAGKKSNSMTALADIGWVITLWGVFFVANQLVLGKEPPFFMKYMLIGGMTTILLFANFQKNILKGVLQTLGNLPLDVISSFSDIVSYIRLFAVGFASFIVASSFNTMAVGSGIDSVVSGIIAAIILFLGHSLNIALCGMAVLVHGVRLNMLEFSGHVGVQWTGKPYEPFKEK
ncbi:hypothetical protein JW960_12675 [candidate division KSB1 bacterium]|nr:hypothetical protein [candidate division KSB1 bacterium]